MHTHGLECTSTTWSTTLLFFQCTDSLQHNHARPLTRGIPETPRMPNAAPHVCACGGRPLVQTYMRCVDRTLRAMGIPIALGRSPAAARLDQSRSRPGCNALAPRDEPLFMDLWTWSLREAARGSGVQRPAPHHSERVPPPLKPHAPSSPHLLSTMRAAAHTRHSGNAAHAERGPTCMCVRRAPSRARPCVAPPGSACSRRLCPAVRGETEPTPPRGATR